MVSKFCLLSNILLCFILNFFLNIKIKIEAIRFYIWKKKVHFVLIRFILEVRSYKYLKATNRFKK
jgi:hypothetical protein